MARLRTGNSDLLSNLYFINLSDTPVCPLYEQSEETACHYLDVRMDILSQLPIYCWNVRCLLNGSDRYIKELNTYYY